MMMSPSFHEENENEKLKSQDHIENELADSIMSSTGTIKYSDRILFFPSSPIFSCHIKNL